MRLWQFVYALGIGDEPVGELHSVVRLNGSDFEGCSFQELFKERLGVIDREFIVDFSESPAGAVIQGGILIMLLSSDAIREVFDVHLDQIPGMGHLIAFRMLLSVL